MIRVGSIKGAGTVGGRKGVGVDMGEQAGARSRIQKRVKTLVLNNVVEPCLTKKWRRSCIKIKKGDPPEGGRPCRASLYFFLESGHTAVRLACANIQRESDFAAQCFLPDDRFDLGHQVEVLAQEILGVLTSLTETNITIGEERTALLNDLEFCRQIEHIA